LLTHCDNGGKIKIKTTHRFAWGNNPKRATLKGRECKILASGKMNSIVVEFEDGQKECVSRMAVRRLIPSETPQPMQMELFN